MKGGHVVTGILAAIVTVYVGKVLIETINARLVTVPGWSAGF